MCGLQRWSTEGPCSALAPPGLCGAAVPAVSLYPRCRCPRGFHGAAEPRGCSPAVCLLPARTDTQGAFSGLHGYCCSFLQSPRNASLPLSLPFPTSPLSLIRLALHGANNTRAYPIKQAHSRRWIVYKTKHDTRKFLSHGFFQYFFFSFPIGNRNRCIQNRNPK